MEWQAAWTDPFTAYISTFYGLIGDLRTQVTFTEIVRGIISAGSLVCQRIAAQSAVLMAAKDGAAGGAFRQGGKAPSAREWMPRA